MKELRRLIKSPGLWLAVFLEIFALLFPHMDSHYFWQTPRYYFSTADFLYHMLMPLRLGLTSLLLPFIAVLPAATFLSEDQRNQYPLLVQYRYGHRQYMHHRICLTITGAVLAAAMGFILYAVFVRIVSSPDPNVMIESWRYLPGSTFDPWINLYQGIPFLLYALFALCITCAAWALIGFSISCLTSNSGLVIGGTFVGYYMTSWLFSYVLHLSPWSPMVLQSPDIYYSGSVSAFTLRLFVWFAVALAVSYLCAAVYLRRQAVGESKSKFSKAWNRSFRYPPIYLILLLLYSLVTAIGQVGNLLQTDTIGAALVNTFGGCIWSEEIDVQYSLSWLMSFLPVSIAVSIVLSEQLSGYIALTGYRYRSADRWYRRLIARITFIILITTLIQVSCVILTARISGHRGISVWVEDLDGFTVSSALIGVLSPVLFILYSEMIGLFAVMIYLIFRNMTGYYIAFLFPSLVGSMMFSNPDQTCLYLPIHFGMSVRLSVDGGFGVQPTVAVIDLLLLSLLFILCGGMYCKLISPFDRKTT